MGEELTPGRPRRLRVPRRRACRRERELEAIELAEEIVDHLASANRDWSHLALRSARLTTLATVISTEAEPERAD